MILRVRHKCMSTYIKDYITFDGFFAYPYCLLTSLGVTKGALIFFVNYTVRFESIQDEV